MDTRAYGRASLEHSVKVEPDDKFEIGSVTKQFTAFATMILVEEKKLALDDSVTKWVEEAPEAWKGVTLRHLLYQTSGLPEYALVPGIGIVDRFERKDWMEKMSKLPMDFEPGTTWAYSNSNYALLGWVIEKASGVRYTEFVTERILKPLGMASTEFGTPFSVIPRRAQGYMTYENDVIRGLPMGSGVDSDGTLISNVADMAKWDEALRSQKILKRDSYARLWSPAVLNSGRTRAYGMGFFLSPKGYTPYVGHHGNSSGYAASHSHFPSANLSVIVMANLYQTSGEALARGVAEIVEPALKPKIPTVTSDPDVKRTERVLAAMAKLAANELDESLFEAEMIAPLKTARARMGAGQFAGLRNVKALEFASAEPVGTDYWITYRATSLPRPLTIFVLWSQAGKIAQILTRPDPVG